MAWYVPRNPRALLFSRIGTQDDSLQTSGPPGTYSPADEHLIRTKSSAMKVVDLMAADLDPHWAMGANYHLKVEVTNGRLELMGATRSLAMYEAFSKCLTHIRGVISQINVINADRVAHTDEPESELEMIDGFIKETIRSVKAQLIALNPSDSIFKVDFDGSLLIVSGYVPSITDLHKAREFVVAFGGTKGIHQADARGIVCNQLG